MDHTKNDAKSRTVKNDSELIQSSSDCASESESSKEKRLEEGAEHSHHYSHIQLLRNYVTVFTGHTGSALIGFVTSVILARYLTQDDFGIYSAYVALATIFATLVDVGINQSLVRFGSTLSSTEQSGSLARMVKSAIKGKIVLGLLIGAVGGVILNFTSMGSNLGNVWLVILVPVGGIMLSFFYTLNGVLQIKRAFRKVSSIMLLKAVILIVTSLVAIALGATDALTMSVLFVVSAIVAVIAFSGEIKNLLNGPLRDGPIIGGELKTLLRFGKWIGISGMAFVIFEQIPITAALAMFGSPDVALLSVSLVLVGALRLLNVPLLTILMPDLSRIRTKSELRRYLKITYRFVAPASIIIFFAMIYFSEEMIILFYGSSYADSSILFSVLVVPFVLVFATLPLTSAMTYVFNRPQIPAIINVIQLIGLLCVVTILSSNVDIVILTASYAAIRGGGTLIVAAVGLFGVMRWDPVHSAE